MWHLKSVTPQLSGFTLMFQKQEQFLFRLWST
jgi:hypothetical protein